MEVLIQKLTIKNFGLHRETILDFPAKPVLIFVGANGSGKTQILEAILLAFGYQSARIRGAGFRKFIGPWGEKALIEIVVSNPINENGERKIIHPSNEINQILNSDSFVLSCELSAQGIIYAINGKKTFKGKKLTQSTIREIAHLAGINPTSKLAFTAEDTVTNFARESDRKKLETLLEAVGKQDYYSRLEELKIELHSIEKEIDPLEKTLILKKANLEAMERSLAALKERSRLLERLEYLKRELAWARVGQVEGTKKELETSIEQRKSIVQVFQNELEELQEKIRTLKASKESLTEELAEQKDIQSVLIGKKAELQHRKTMLQQELISLDKNLAMLREKVKQIGDSPRNMIDAKIKQLQSRLRQITKEYDLLSSQKKALEAKIQKLKQEKYAEATSKNPSREMTNWEKTLLRDAGRFKYALSEARVSGILGPIIEEIELAADLSWEPSVKRAIGRYLFSFLAISRDAFYMAKKIYDKEFGKARSPILVVRFDSSMGKKREKKSFPKESMGFADDLVVGPWEVKAFLKEVVNTVLIIDHENPNFLADLARKHQVAILTKSGYDYFERIGGFTRPPPPVHSRLGHPIPESKTPVPSYPEKDALQEAQEQLTMTMQSLISITKTRSEIQDEVRALESILREQYAGKDYNKEIQELLEKQKEAQQKLEETKQSLSEVSEQIEKISHEILEKEALLKDIDSGIYESNLRIANIHGQLEQLRKELQRISQSQDILQKEYDSLLQEALAVGERPEQLRLPTVVEEELAKVKGHLESIVGGHIKEEDVERARKEINELEEYLEHRHKHMEGLKNDIEARLEQWKHDVTELTEYLSETITKLLEPTGVGEVIIRVRKAHDPSIAELSIMIRGAGRVERKFSSLSGGEKVMITTALVMALHLRSESAIHGLDEFSQRLDPRNTALAFEILHQSARLATTHASGFIPQYLIFMPGIHANINLDEELTEVFFIGRIARPIAQETKP